LEQSLVAHPSGAKIAGGDGGVGVMMVAAVEL
jgi:hypothetical protein